MHHSRIVFWAATGIAGLFLGVVSAVADDWPQWRGPNRDGVWQESGLIERFSTSPIALKWRAPISNGYSGPTVAEGRVYVTDRVENPEECERVLCFDAETGAPLWTHSYPCTYGPIGYKNGPRASVTIVDGLAYALGAVGHLRCLNAATGELVWKKEPGVDYEPDLPIWGIAAAPLVEGELLIAQIGVPGGGCLIAWDRRTGEERWRALDDPASYSAPIVIDQAGKRVLVCWAGDHVAGLNPETGEVYWKLATPRSKEVINVPTPAISGDRMFLTSVYDGSYMLRLGQDAPTIELLWHRKGESEMRSDALHAMMATPVMLGDYVYGVDCYGQVRCLKAENGDRVWEDLTLTPQRRWGNIHMVQNGAITWMFNELGELIITRLSPQGCEHISRAQLIETTRGQLGRGDGVCWSHPAYANRCVFARNDQELVCASLAAE